MDKKSISTLRTQLAPTTIGRFTDDLAIDDSVTLTEEEIKDKCFELLGLLEEYQTLSGETVDAEFIVENLNFSGFVNHNLDHAHVDADLGGFYAQLSAQTEEPDKGIEATQVRESIRNQIRSILSLPQVKEVFESELAKELPKFKKARGAMRRVAEMQMIERATTSQMIQTYLKSKRKSGKLSQSATNKISALQRLKTEAEERETATRSSANKETKGWLVAQDLLQYKRQIEDRGFALTPTRKTLLDKITEQAMSGKKVFLVGSTGTGKTELAFYALDEISGGYEVIPWHEGTTTRDIFGYREIGLDEHGNITSRTKPGPFTKAVDEGRGVLHDEYTVGSTRTMMAQKHLLNAKAGDEVKIPGFNGQVFEVGDQFAEIFTGNLKDERTQAREDMDPAILRMFKGIKVQYMPAEEMTQIILANLMEANGVMKLSPSEVAIIQRLSRAAEWMQLFHDRQFEAIKATLSPDQLSLLTTDFGGDLADARIDKNFLDPGTLFSLFANMDFAQAKGKKFRKFLAEALTDFLQDPKNDNNPEEKDLALLILKLTGVATNKSTVDNVTIKKPKEDDKKGYILPSELHFLAEKSITDEDPFDDEEGEKEEDKETTNTSSKNLTEKDIPDSIKQEDKDKIINVFNPLPDNIKTIIEQNQYWKEVMAGRDWDWDGNKFTVNEALEFIKSIKPLFQAYDQLTPQGKQAIEQNQYWKEVMAGRDWDGDKLTVNEALEFIKSIKPLFQAYDQLTPQGKQAIEQNQYWKEVMAGRDWDGDELTVNEALEFIKSIKPLFQAYDQLTPQGKQAIEQNQCWKEVMAGRDWDWDGNKFTVNEALEFIKTLT